MHFAIIFINIFIRHFRESFHSINPNSINATNLVELQVSFMAIKVKRGEYIFLPKLRSICVLDRIVEKVSIYLLALKWKVDKHI